MLLHSERYVRIVSKLKFVANALDLVCFKSLRTLFHNLRALIKNLLMLESFFPAFRYQKIKQDHRNFSDV